MSTLTMADLKVLRAPFSRDRLCVKVQSLNPEKTRAMLVLYLQHTDVQERLDQVDPTWTFEVTSEERSGEMVYVRAQIRLLGVARENVGEGRDPKAAYSDALKRCAMLFGIGRYLYSAPTVWVDYNPRKDHYREWTVDEYEAVAKPKAASSPPKPKAAAKSQPKPRAKTAAPPVKPLEAVAAATGPAPAQAAGPQCCGIPMQVSRFNPNQLYCPTCRFKQARRAEAVPTHLIALAGNHGRAIKP